MKTRFFLTTVVLILATFLNAEAANVKGKSTESFISHYVVATDAELSLENWMVNECYWKCMEFNCLARDFDHVLVLEPWMTNVGKWEFEVCIPVDAEAPNGLESWMTDVESWEANNQFPAAQDSPLHLESWMTDMEGWEADTMTTLQEEKPLRLESWMTDGMVWNDGIERFVVTIE